MSNVSPGSASSLRNGTNVQLDVFVAPIRLYHSALHNNRLGIGLNMAQIKLPKMQLQSVMGNPSGHKQIDNVNINPSCIMSYLGIRGVGSSGALMGAWYRKFNAVPFLMYWDVYKNYYANKQEEIGAVIHAGIDNYPITVTSISIGGTTLSSDPNNQVPVLINGEETMVIAYSGATPDPKSIFIKFGGFDELVLFLLY